MVFGVCNKNRIHDVHSFLHSVDKCFPIPLSQKTDLYELSEKLLEKGRVFVACEDNNIIGIVGEYANDEKSKKAYISVVAVLPEYSGKGIATTLIDNAMDYAKSNGMEKIFLYTHKTNEGAIHMYKKLGFIPFEDAIRPNDILFEREL